MIAEDTAAVLDHLGVEQFVSLGTSGGGPHAFADGALLGGRCQGVVDVAGLAPPDLAGLDFYDGMGDDNRASFEAAQSGPEALAPVADLYHSIMSEVTADVLMETARTLLPPVDAAMLDGPDARSFVEYFAAMMRAAFSSGTSGMVDDMIALSQPWGFDLAQVEVPVIVWHGEADENVPVGHGRAIIAALPSCTARILPDHGHVSIFTELPAIVDDLAALAT
jgi:pimeloyl-ACP methyl ester carboxylesterase